MVLGTDLTQSAEGTENLIVLKKDPPWSIDELSTHTTYKAYSLLACSIKADHNYSLSIQHHRTLKLHCLSKFYYFGTNIHFAVLQYKFNRQ